MKLYQISAEIAQVEMLLGLPESEYPEQQLLDALSNLDMALEKKVEDICSLLKSMKIEEDGIKEESSSLKRRAETLGTKREWLLTYLTQNIPEGQNYSSTKHKLSWNKSSKSEVSDEASLPEKYKVKTIVESLDKRTLLADLRAGGTVPGAVLVKTSSLKLK